jgi:NADPH:quinone reductase-like Zn-dependent oxidoreductase
MLAAVVTTFDAPPRPAEWPEPVPTQEDDLVVEVLAAGLHPRVRSQADGSHYTSTEELPLVPGVDGVGRDGDGALRYFILEDTVLGSMAERTVIDRRRSIVLPEGVDASDAPRIAAAVNPAMSAWVALRQRIDFRPGQRVLVLGATGSAGRMAVRVAALFGASEVVAAGRDAARLAALPALGATSTVSLVGDPDEVAARLGAAAADVDVVIDYVWGATTAAAMVALVTARSDRGKPLTWIEVGSVGGPTATIPSAALRAARLQVVGSGQGSVPTEQFLAELPAIALAIARRELEVDVEAVPLRHVERAWATSDTDRRTVLVP